MQTHVLVCRTRCASFIYFLHFILLDVAAVPAPFPDTSLGKKLPSHHSPWGCCLLLPACPAAASSQGAPRYQQERDASVSGQVSTFTEDWEKITRGTGSGLAEVKPSFDSRLWKGFPACSASRGLKGDQDGFPSRNLYPD